MYKLFNQIKIIKTYFALVKIKKKYEPMSLYILILHRAPCVFDYIHHYTYKQIQYSHQLLLRLQSPFIIAPDIITKPPSHFYLLLILRIVPYWARN